MNKEAIIAQSKAAYGQWAKQWREHAVINGKYEQKSFENFRNVGVGKAILCVANGYSFEENIEVIKQYKDNVDILACDKTLGSLLDHGIEPTYCMVCDANVDYEKYLAKYKDRLQNTILFSNVCGNPLWAQKGNWKEVYFFANRDVLASEKEFMGLSGCPNSIPAGTNVSNAMVILLNQSDEKGIQNFFGYDKILLIGFDYSWREDGNYYAFDKSGDGKNQYMRHMHILVGDGKWAYTSGNLLFSVQWLDTYIKTYRVPAVQCSKDTILNTIRTSNLKDQIQYKYKSEDANVVRQIVNELKTLNDKMKSLDLELFRIERDHKRAVLCST